MLQVKVISIGKVKLLSKCLMIFPPGGRNVIKVILTNFDTFSFSNHEARYSNDIVIAYVHELSGYAGKALPYLMHLGASGVVIRFDGLFDPYLLAHEVGHVLGAGHRYCSTLHS